MRSLAKTYLPILCCAVTGCQQSSQLNTQQLQVDLQNLKLQVSEFYLENATLPNSGDSPLFRNGLGFDQQLEIIAPGIIRITQNSNSAGAATYLVASENSGINRLNFECTTTQAEISSAVTGCRYDADFNPVKQQTQTATANPIEALPPMSPDQYVRTFAAGSAAQLLECLKPWAVNWKLPYYPALSGQCKAVAQDAAGKNVFFKQAVRSTRVKLTPHLNPLFVRHGSYGSYDMSSALFAHFDQLLASQGFDKTAWVTNQNAVYQRHDLRISFDVVAGNLIEMQLDSVAELNEQTQLPTPQTTYNLFETGHYTDWFALPSATLVKEHIGYGYTKLLDVAPHNPDTFIVPYWGDLARLKQMHTAPPTKVLTYLYPKDIPSEQIRSAYQVALQRAGWQVIGKNEWSFVLPDRALTLELRFFDIDDNKVTATLYDSVFGARVEVISRAWRDRSAYIFTPSFVAGTEMMSDDTEFQVIALDQYLRKDLAAPPPNNQGIVFSPALGSQFKNDPGALAQAVKQAQWLMQIFAKRGWPAAQLQLSYKPVIPDREDSNYHYGVHVTGFNCFIAVGSKACECKTERNLISIQSSPELCP